jgi:hypothetical protein
MKIYTGIGSRKTPENILRIIESISKRLDESDFLLRSGGAFGADQAFEKYSNTKEIYLPWNGFNEKWHDGLHYFSLLEDAKIYDKAILIVEQFHPYPKKLSIGGRRLMARNAFQVLGKDLKTPSDAVICWTKNAQQIGGTSQAIRLAKQHDIPILNLGNPHIEKFFKDTF